MRMSSQMTANTDWVDFALHPQAQPPRESRLAEVAEPQKRLRLRVSLDFKFQCYHLVAIFYDDQGPELRYVSDDAIDRLWQTHSDKLTDP